MALRDIVQVIKRAKDSGESSRDHLVKLDLDKDIVLALDDKGNELCKFGFEVSGKLITFSTPVLSRWGGFLRRMAILFSKLSQYAPNLEIPSDVINNFTDPTSNAIWQSVSAKILAFRKSVVNLCLEIFFVYLNGRIEGLPSSVRKQKKWFKNNAEIIHLQKIFAAALAVDDLVKKNATFVLMSQFRKSSAESTAHISAPNSESQSNGSTDTPSFIYGQL